MWLQYPDSEMWEGEREKVKHIRIFRIPPCVSGSAQVNKAWVADTT